MLEERMISTAKQKWDEKEEEEGRRGKGNTNAMRDSRPSPRLFILLLRRKNGCIDFKLPSLPRKNQTEA